YRPEAGWLAQCPIQPGDGAAVAGAVVGDDGRRHGAAGLGAAAGALMRRTPDSAGTTPGGRQPRFPGFDVLAQVDSWDAVTAGVVLARLGPPPPIRFFTPDEEAIARPLLDLLLDQHEEPRVPVLR